MSTTLSPIRIAEWPRLDDVPYALNCIRSGLSNAVAGVDAPEILAAIRESDRPGEEWIEHPGMMAWEKAVDEAAAEIAPQVAELLHEAISRRLPWTWEPER
jgi:hypothetical protein